MEAETRGKSYKYFTAVDNYVIALKQVTSVENYLVL
jgi:hypothetical protein